MMAGKSKKPAAPQAEKFPRKAVPLKLAEGDSKEVAVGKFAKLVTSPELAAYRAISASEAKSGFGEHIDVPTLLEELCDQAAAVNRGDLSNAEAMLMNQATALQSIFARLAERGLSCELAPAFESNMRMALRAQSQCRATLETLAAIKNPPIVYARQANIANGPQQVNNGMAAQYAREEKTIQSNELLTDGVEHGPTLDTRGTAAAGGTDKDLATLGSLDRPKDGGR